MNGATFFSRGLELGWIEAFLMNMQRLSQRPFVTAILAITLLGAPGWTQNQHELNQQADKELKAWFDN